MAPLVRGYAFSKLGPREKVNMLSRAAAGMATPKLDAADFVSKEQPRTVIQRSP
jgi:hypothetical protein